MASTLVTPIANALVSTLSGLSVSPTVNAFLYDIANLNGPSTPYATVNPPEVKRTTVNQVDSQIGANDWTMRYPVRIAVAQTGTPANDPVKLVEILEAFVMAIDANQTLGLAYVERATVINTLPPFYIGSTHLAWDVTVQVRAYG